MPLVAVKVFQGVKLVAVVLLPWKDRVSIAKDIAWQADCIPDDADFDNIRTEVVPRFDPNKDCHVNTK